MLGSFHSDSQDRLDLAWRDFSNRRRLSHKPEPAEVREMVQATDPASIVQARIRDRDPVHPWGSGRATLIGDSVHATTPDIGQGACQAMEDALVLSSSLRDAATPADGLRAYEQRRRRRAEHYVLLSRRIGVVSHWRHPVLCALRTPFFRYILGPIGARESARDAEFDF